MRKIVDVYIFDKLRASYPVLLSRLEEPSDEDFVEHVREQMRLGSYAEHEIASARFIVRD
jgi:hypothetical protein